MTSPRHAALYMSLQSTRAGDKAFAFKELQLKVYLNSVCLVSFHLCARAHVTKVSVSLRFSRYFLEVSSLEENSFPASLAVFYTYWNLNILCICLYVCVSIYKCQNPPTRRWYRLIHICICTYMYHPTWNNNNH